MHIVQSHNVLKLGHPKCTFCPRSRTSQSRPTLPNIGWAEVLWVQPKSGIGCSKKLLTDSTKSGVG